MSLFGTQCAVRWRRCWRSQSVVGMQTVVSARVRSSSNERSTTRAASGLLKAGRWSRSGTSRTRILNPLRRHRSPISVKLFLYDSGSRSVTSVDAAIDLGKCIAPKCWPRRSATVQALITYSSRWGLAEIVCSAGGSPLDLIVNIYIALMLYVSFHFRDDANFCRPSLALHA